MTRHAKKLAAGLLLLILSATAPAWGESPRTQNLPRMRQDAELADVCFVDAKRGWAVGDRGVIWHTGDGGATWKQQESPVTCRLNSVCFVDAEYGWAAGGSTTPLTHIPQGVVLLTRDGGKTWKKRPRLMVPTFRRIKFFDRERGVAFGAPSALFPSGVFTSDDGGHTWKTVPSDAGQTWLAGDFIDPLTGALAGRGGPPAVVRRRALAASETPPLGLRAAHAMKLVAPNFGWMVGDGGLVMRTVDLGKTWQTVPGQLPGGAAEYFDLHALAARGNTLWVAGSPGTRVFRSRDGGRTWTARDTGVFAPIRDLVFVDDRHGWAVGALGTILATSDGGDTWRKQRGGGERAALLGLFGEPSAMPLELLASLSGGKGYLAHIELIGRRDLDEQSSVEAGWARRAHEAAVLVGACGADAAWRFPLRQDGLGFSVEQLLADFDRANDGRALEKLEEHFVRAIRLWRPDVVVTHHASVRGKRPLAHLINQMTLRAIDRAADPTSHVALATTAGLPPWQVQKVYSTVPRGESGSVSINTARLDPRLGRSVGALAGAARGLVAEKYAPPAVEVGFRLLIDRAGQGRGREDFFAGIPLSPGGAARRMLAEPLRETIDQLRRVAQKRRNMQELIRRGEEEGAGLDVTWSGQLGDLTEGLDEASSSQLLYQLAGQYLRQGNWRLAAGTYEALVQRHPRHPLAHAAQLWLLRYYASGEAAWRERKQSGIVAQRASWSGSGSRQTSGKSPFKRRKSGDFRYGGARGFVGDAAQQRDVRVRKALAIGKTLEQTVPTLFAEPRVGFPLASAQRKLGYGDEAGRFYLHLRRARGHDAWWAAAQGERWLAERKGLPPKSIWTVQRADHKPRLDGKLDEAFWRRALPVELKSALNEDGAWPAQARLAYDGQFLYLGIQCGKAPGAEYPTSDAPRPRDGDLSSRDRVSVLLDLDRDYATYYRLTIDHRGWTGEACWDDATWNPTWYVAHAESDDSWTAEAAIALAELTGLAPKAGHVWAAGAQRVVPGVGFQSWTQPAGVEIAPQGFGFLMFE